MIESHKQPVAAEIVPTVFVVEDDASVRLSLELLIRASGWTPRLFGTAREFLACPAVDVPRCLILDVSLPDVNGLDLQQCLTGRKKMPVIFITGGANVSMTVRAMKAGAFEFLSKPFDHETLCSAIAQALLCSKAELEHGEHLRALARAYASLTSRERQVMQMVVSGQMNKQIASELGISELTVKAHSARVMRKMSVRSVAALVRLDAELFQAPQQHNNPNTRAVSLPELTELSLTHTTRTT